MAKDPRFNFYVDNWIGGTEGFTLEQEGAYLALIIMQSKVGRFTYEQAIDKLMQKTRGNTAVCTELWNFLIQKFTTDGNVFWNERLEKEMEKSRKHSEKQSERIKKRWKKENNQSGTPHGNTVVLPDNSIGIGNGIRKENKKESEIFPSDILRSDELCLESLSREAGKLGVKISECFDKWDGWYCSKFTAWRKDWGDEKLTFNDLRKSFETWMRDPRSTSHTNRALIEERKRLAKNL